MRNPLFRVLNQEYSRRSGWRCRHRSRNPICSIASIMRCRIDRPRLVDICATSIKVADGQCTLRALQGEGSDQRFPIRDLGTEVRQIDADEPEHVKIYTDHPIGLKQSHADGAVFAKGAPGGNKHTVAAGRWENCGCVPVAERMQGSRKPLRRRTAAIFGKNHDLGVVTLQRLGNSGEPGSAALSDVPSEQPHGPELTLSRAAVVRLLH